MPFLPPNQQRQRTEDSSLITTGLVFYLCVGFAAVTASIHVGGRAAGEARRLKSLSFADYHLVFYSRNVDSFGAIDHTWLRSREKVCLFL